MVSNKSGIYQIIHTKSGKRYVGSAVRFDRRWASHRSYLKKGTHANAKLQNVYNKYGPKCFDYSVVEVVDRGELSPKEFKLLLLSREQWYLDNWVRELNILDKAGSRLGMPHSVEAKSKMSAAKIGNSYAVGNTHSDSTKKQLSLIKRLTPSRGYSKALRKGGVAWVVQFRVGGKTTSFGCFATEEEASRKASEVRASILKSML